MTEYEDIHVEVIPQLIYDLDQSPLGKWLTYEAHSQSIATDQEINHWLDELKEKSKRGEMFAMVNMVIVAGTKKR